MVVGTAGMNSAAVLATGHCKPEASKAGRGKPLDSNLKQKFNSSFASKIATSDDTRTNTLGLGYSAMDIQESSIWGGGVSKVYWTISHYGQKINKSVSAGVHAGLQAWSEEATSPDDCTSTGAANFTETNASKKSPMLNINKKLVPLALVLVGIAVAILPIFFLVSAVGPLGMLVAVPAAVIGYSLINEGRKLYRVNNADQRLDIGPLFC